jgi:hypothetical protein
VRGVGFEPTNALLCLSNMWVTQNTAENLDIKKTGRQFYSFFSKLLKNIYAIIIWVVIKPMD